MILKNNPTNPPSSQMIKIYPYLFAVLFMCRFLSIQTGRQPAFQSVTAFPGAEGFGKFASGGRGGMVYIVTNLNDSGPGSLRWALEARGPRTVVFEVSGTIELRSRINIREGNLTIAGQTAPGEGIAVRNFPIIVVGTRNVILRFFRSRLGDTSRAEEDAISVRGSSEIIIDHCSFSWGMDETFSIGSSQAVTVQNTIISEGLNYSIHSDGEHGFGSLFSGSEISIIGNLWIHFTNRNPAFLGRELNGVIDLRNNVIYNWEFRPTSNGNRCSINVVSNYYKPGPATLARPASQLVKRRFFSGTGPDYGKLYLEGNRLEGMPELASDQWLGVRLESGLKTERFLEELKNKDENGNLAPFPIPSDIYSSTLTADEAFESVLAYAGASLVRDAVDKRLVEEVSTGTATFKGSKSGLLGIIDSQEDVGGWPELKSLPAPKDTDRDGMPDVWEVETGLNPYRRDDRFFDLDSNYTNLEVSLNSLVLHLMGN